MRVLWPLLPPLTHYSGAWPANQSLRSIGNGATKATLPAQGRMEKGSHLPLPGEQPRVATAVPCPHHHRLLESPEGQGRKKDKARALQEQFQDH